MNEDRALSALGPSVQAYPVKSLREQVVALEAALSVCLADPGQRPVHRLRTATRRVEAQLLLLARMPALPEHRKEATALLRALRKLRRAGGKVRDLDVHRALLEEFAAAHQPAPAEEREDGVPAATPTLTPEEMQAEPAAADPLHAAALELREHLKAKRAEAADELSAMLKERQTKAALAAEAMLAVLEPAAEMAMPAEDLLRNATALLARDGLLARGKIGRLSADELHTVRKAAKAARYLAETVPEDEALAAAAAKFEALQEAGGQWHDALEINREARRFFGKDHALTRFYKGDRDTRLAAFREALEAQTEAAQPAKALKKRAAKKAAGSSELSLPKRRERR